MSTNPKPAFRRILLKLSGEALMGEEGFGIGVFGGVAGRGQAQTEHGGKFLDQDGNP